jgi:uncharacterized protein
VRIRVQDIDETVKHMSFAEKTSDLNPLLDHGLVHDFCFGDTAGVQMTYYRGGQDLFLEGNVSAPVVGQCARCLESYDFDLETGFSFVLVPRSEAFGDAEPGVEDADLSFYEGDEIDVSPLLREQMLLALPTQALCRPDCQGLCPSCGANLNADACDCHEETGDPRLTVLRSLKARS